jgi:RNA polymerase sigma-70 factor (ECF subfamily)
VELLGPEPRGRGSDHPARSRAAALSAPANDLTAVPALVERLFRVEAGRLVPRLTRLLGVEHLALAEDATQDAFIAALGHWPRTGVPDDPGAWLLQVARRKALDVLRRERTHDAYANQVLAGLERSDDAHAPDEDAAFADDQLHMMLLCCHPALSEDSRIALTLRTVSGLSVSEIARAFLADEAAVAQRLVRAKRTLRETKASFALPAADAIESRRDAVLDVLYLLFNEGHTAHEGEALLREELCVEALRLVELLAAHPATTAPHVHALAALFCFHAARLGTRTDARGALVRLADQDRTAWDARAIARGLQHLDRAARGSALSRFHLEAEIASCHATAPSAAATDWPRILRCYDALVALTQSPVAALNRAVALRQVAGPELALAEIERLQAAPGLGAYHAYHGVRAELLEDVGRGEEAAAAWTVALGLARSEPVRRFLAGRLDLLQDADVDSAASRPSSVRRAGPAGG